MKIQFKMLALSIMFISFGCATKSAHAEGENGNSLHGYFSIGAGSTPEYEGADYQETIPFIAGRAQWGYRYIELQGLSVKANILNNDAWEFGPVVSAGLGRDKKVDSVRVARLAEIDDAVSLGVFGARVWRDIGMEGGEFTVSANALEDVSDVYDSWQANISAGYSAPISDKWRIGGEISASIVSDDYADTYFSVTPAGSTASGLRVFKAEGGLKDVSISINASYAVTNRWSINGFARYSQLQGDASDSPIVDREGSANQSTFGLGVGYSF
jgi:MipA family protein